MPEYLGSRMGRADFLSRVGDPAQVARAVRAVLRDGRAEGVEAVQVCTGSGLEFMALPGRGMDIPFASCGGKSLGFFSGTGITSAAYYEEPGEGWLRSAYFGLLTTCGIASCGFPSNQGGRAYGLHGRISNTAAEDVGISQEWKGDDYVITLRGVLREAHPFGENFRLVREIETSLGSDTITIRDTIENRSFDPQPLMMLYHFNFGYPLLGPTAKVEGPILRKLPIDEEARSDRGLEESQEFPDPVEGYRQKVFFYDLAADGEGKTFIALLNPDIGDGAPLGIVLRFNKNELPKFTHWKLPRRGSYVTGLEPGTVGCRGRGPELASGECPVMEPQSARSVSLALEVLRDRGVFESLRAEAARLTASSGESTSCPGARGGKGVAK